jgi:hypothetical protein
MLMTVPRPRIGFDLDNMRHRMLATPRRGFHGTVTT